MIDGEIMEKGIIALDAKIFLEMVRKLPDNDVTIETDATYKATITCEKVFTPFRRFDFEHMIFIRILHSNHCEVCLNLLLRRNR